MIHLWKDKGQTWSCFAWPAVLKVIPKVLFLGMTYCKDYVLCKLPGFYGEVLCSYAEVNKLNVSGEAGQQRNIWASDLHPGISMSMIQAGFIEIADLPVLNSMLDYKQVQYWIQQSGSAENVFLLCPALQCIFCDNLGIHPLER